MSHIIAGEGDAERHVSIRCAVYVGSGGPYDEVASRRILRRQSAAATIGSPYPPGRGARLILFSARRGWV